MDHTPRMATATIQAEMATLVAAPLPIAAPLTATPRPVDVQELSQQIAKPDQSEPNRVSATRGCVDLG